MSESGSLGGEDSSSFGRGGGSGATQQSSFVYTRMHSLLVHRPFMFFSFCLFFLYSANSYIQCNLTSFVSFNTVQSISRTS